MIIVKGAWFRSERRGLLTSLFVVLVMAFLYWGYPWDGMMISDSWFLYSTDGGEFKWWTREQLANREAVTHPREMTTFTMSWDQLYSRRGLMPIAVWAIDRFTIGNRQVFVNVLCVLVQVVNVWLFAMIIGKIAGPRLLFPIVLCAVLYPFSAGSHFWQYLIINNLAVTCFLVSFALFLQIDFEAGKVSQGMAIWAFLSLLCFWLSMLFLDYGVLMGPLYLYVALYYSNGKRSLARFSSFQTPASVIGLAFTFLSFLAVVLFAHGAPTFQVYDSRFEELAAYMPLPVQALKLSAVLANGTLVFLSCLFSNTAGYVLYPGALVAGHAEVFQEAPAVLLGIGFLAFLGVALLRVLERNEETPAVLAGSPSERFILMVGTLWTALSYIPFATAFGYPRTVGLMADRANILALWGVSICIGVLLHRLFVTARYGSFARCCCVYGGGFFLFVVLLSNLYVQKEYYVEAYRKEMQLARLILDNSLLGSGDERAPVVLLEREEKVTFPRDQLMAAVKNEGLLPKGKNVLRVLAKRYFFQEYITSSFHLGGIMMFGCCPTAASVTIDGYAKLLKRKLIAVYKYEPPFHFEQWGEIYRVGYKDTEAWSNTKGTFRYREYARPKYRVMRVKIADAFFHLRGGLSYHVSSYPSDSVN